MTFPKPNQPQWDQMIEVAAHAIVEAVCIAAGEDGIDSDDPPLELIEKEITEAMFAVKGNRDGMQSITWRDMQLVFAHCLRRAADIADNVSP